MAETDFIDEQIARGQLYAEVDPIFGNLVAFAGDDPFRLKGIMISYGLLRRELSRRPQRVAEALRIYDVQLARYVEIAQKLAKDQQKARADAAKYFDASKQLKAAGGTVKSGTAGGGSGTTEGGTYYNVAAMGQALEGLLKIADMFVGAVAERVAAGLSANIFEPIITGDTNPVFSGWRTQAGFRFLWKDATEEQARAGAGYWVQDIPVLSFLAPMVCAGLAKRYPGNAAIFDGVSLLCQAYPYGPRDPVALASVGNGGATDVEVRGVDGAYLVKWPDGPSAGKTILGPCTVMQMVVAFPPAASLAPPEQPPWVGGVARALFYAVGAYHDGFLARPRQPYPVDFMTPENKAALDQHFNLGVTDKATGAADRFAGQKGLGDPLPGPAAVAPYNGQLAPPGLSGMVKEQSNDAVYVVENGRLRWILPPEYAARGGAAALRIVPDGGLRASPVQPTEAQAFQEGYQWGLSGATPGIVPVYQESPALSSAWSRGYSQGNGEWHAKNRGAAPPVPPATDAPQMPPASSPAPPPALPPAPQVPLPTGDGSGAAVAIVGGLAVLFLGGTLTVLLGRRWRNRRRTG